MPYSAVEIVQVEINDLGLTWSVSAFSDILLLKSCSLTGAFVISPLPPILMKDSGAVLSRLRLMVLPTSVPVADPATPSHSF